MLRPSETNSYASERQQRELENVNSLTMCRCGHPFENHFLGKLRTFYCNTPKDYCLCPMFRKKHWWNSKQESPYRKRPEVKSIGSV
jgi:hypothetical protein